MIVDVFTFYNEMDLLSLRIRYLSRRVDQFWALTSDVNFLGENNDIKRESIFQIAQNLGVDLKILTYFSRRDLGFRLKKLFLMERLKWHVQDSQRDVMVNFFNDLNTEDLLILSDVDEIPSINVIEEYLRSGRGFLSARQDFYYFSFRWKRPSHWFGSIFGRLSDYQKLRPSRIRSLRNSWPCLSEHGGWHLSYFGGVGMVDEKRRLIFEKGFVRQEVGLELPSALDAVERGIDPWGRPNQLINCESQGVRPPQELVSLLTLEEKNLYGV